MSVLAGLIGALATIFSAGFGVTMLLVRARLRLAEQCAVAWLLGTAVVSASVWIFGLFLHGIALQGVVTAITVLLGIAGVRRWQAFASIPRTASPTLVDILSRIVFAVEIVAIFWLSLQHTLGWDGLTVWELKARYAFLNGGALPVAYFSDTARWFSHPEYPLLLPLTETWFYFWIGDCDQFWIKLIFPIWYLAGAAMLWRAAGRLSGRRWTGWIIVLLFPLVPAIHNAPGGVSVGYADIPLAAIYSAAIFYLLRLLAEESGDALALLIALGATLPWMKREGAILWLGIMLWVGVLLWIRGRRLLSALSFLPGIMVIGGWKLFLLCVHALPSRDFVSATPARLLANASRLGGILHELGLTLGSTSLWDIFWLLSALALIMVARRQRDRSAATIAWLLLAPLLAYTGSYVFSAWPDFIDHIDTSLPRLLIQLTPAAWLLIALALNPQGHPTPPGQPAPQPASRLAHGTDYN